MYDDGKHTSDESQATGTFRVKGAPVDKDYIGAIMMDVSGTSPEVAAEQMVASLQEMLACGDASVRVAVRDTSGQQTLVDVAIDADLYIRATVVK